MSILGQITAQQPNKAGWQLGVNTGVIDPLYQEEYTGEVEHQILKSSFMKGFFKIHNAQGQGVISNKAVGTVKLQKLVGGVMPTDNSPIWDKASLRVDTVVLARSTLLLVDDFLKQEDVRKAVAEEQGKEIGKFIDEAFLGQAIKAAQYSVRRPIKDANNNITGYETLDGFVGQTSGVYTLKTLDTVDGQRGATTIKLANVGDDVDPDKLETAIKNIAQGLEEKDLELGEGILLLRPKHYYTLLNNNKLLDRDFSADNGDYAKGSIIRSCGMKLVKTNRFPSANQVGQTHFLSNAANNFAYDVTTADTKCVAVYVAPKALLAADLIPLSTDFFFEKTSKQFYIDAWISFGVTVNRPAYAAGIFENA